MLKDTISPAQLEGKVVSDRSISSEFLSGRRDQQQRTRDRASAIGWRLILVGCPPRSVLGRMVQSLKRHLHLVLGAIATLQQVSIPSRSTFKEYASAHAVSLSTSVERWSSES